MLSIERPQDFDPDFEVVGCFLEHQGEVLILKRAPGKLQAGSWGLPAGKVSEGESLEEAAVRETKEETGIDLEADALRYIAPVYVEQDGRKLVFHMFTTPLVTRPPQVTLSPAEHVAFDWRAPATLLEMPDLIADFDPCIRLAYGL